MGTVQSVKMNIYQSNTCRKDLSWLHLDDEPRVQERQQVKDQQFYAPAQTWQKYSMQGHMVDLKRCRATSEERNFMEHIKAPIFSEAVLAILIMWEPKLTFKEKDNSGVIKDDFCWRVDPASHFNIIAPVILDWSNKASWVFKYRNPLLRKPLLP